MRLRRAGDVALALTLCVLPAAPPAAAAPADDTGAPPAAEADLPKVVAPRAGLPGPLPLDDPGAVASASDACLATAPPHARAGWESAAGKVGTVRTAVVSFAAGRSSRLLLDAETDGGEIRVQFRDADDRVVPGFSFADCVPVRGAGARLPVEWNAAAGKDSVERGLVDLARLDRQSVRVEFALREARLYAFAVDPGREPPIRLGKGPHLFVDDFLVARTEDLARVVRPPDRHPAPAVDTSQNPAGQVTAGSLSYDPERKLFRMWHWAPGADARTTLIYRESQDGLAWPGEGEPVLTFNGYGTQVLDEGPDAPDPARRFKLACFIFGPPPGRVFGMYVAFSPDGTRWTFYEGNPVLPYHPVGSPRWKLGVGDIVDPFWNPLRRRYGCFTKLMSASRGEFGLQSRTAREGLGIRLTGQTESLDFLHWEQPRRVFTPDAADAGVTEFYGANVLARGDLLIAFVRILRDDLPAEPGGAVEGIGYTTLAASRDGLHWQRFREPFLDRNPQPGAYDRAFAWVTGVAEAHDRVYLSYAAYDQGHKTGNRRCGVATLPRDRFVARAATGGRAGTLVTPPLVCAARPPLELSVNAEAAGGEIRVQVRDAETGDVVPGFSFDDCAPLEGDGLAQAVRWKRPPDGLRERAFRLEFRLRRARIYGFGLAG